MILSLIEIFMAMMVPSMYQAELIEPLVQRESFLKLPQNRVGQRLSTFRISSKIMGSQAGSVMLALTEVYHPLWKASLWIKG